MSPRRSTGAEEDAQVGFRLGIIGGGSSARLESGGLLSPPGVAWRLSWAVRSAEGWKRPGRDDSGRTEQRAGVPVTTTRVRSAGGEVIQRCYGVGSSEGEAGSIVVEIENGSEHAVALAMCDVAADGGEVVGEGVRDVRGWRVRWARPPGAAPEDAEVPEGTAAVWALPHGTSIRFMVPVTGGSGAGLAGGDLPGAEEVTSGWQRHLDRGIRREFPERVLVDGVRSAVAELLIRTRGPAVEGTDAAGAARAAAGLAYWGYPDEAALVVDAASREVAGDPAGATAVIEGGVAVARTMPEPAEWLLELLARQIEVVSRRTKRGSLPPGRWIGDLPGLRGLLASAGQERLEGAVRALADRARDAHLAPPGPDVAELVASATSRLETGGRGVGEATRLALAAADLGLAQDGEGVGLAPYVPSSWFGRNWQVFGVPTPSGPVSYAVRWHGARPAVLWEVPEGCLPLSAPGLDPTWSAREPAGEALLAAPVDGPESAPEGNSER